MRDTEEDMDAKKDNNYISVKKTVRFQESPKSAETSNKTIHFKRNLETMMKIDTNARSADLEYWAVGVAMCNEDENAEDKNLVLPNMNPQGKNMLEKEVHQEQVTVLVPQMDHVKSGKPLNYVVLKAGNQQEYDILLNKTEYTMIGDYLVLKTSKTTSLLTILLKPRDLEHVQIY